MFLTDAAGELWGAVTSPLQTVGTAASNVWDSLTFNFGYLFGSQKARDQVQADIDSWEAAREEWRANNPGGTDQDYTDYLTSTFPDRFDAYVNQGNTGSANNAVSQLGNTDVQNIVVTVGVIALIIALIKR